MSGIDTITLVYAGLMTLIGAALLLRPKALSKTLTKLLEGSGDMFDFGVLATIMGLIVLSFGHQIRWMGTLWVVPLLGWITLVKGVLLVLFPDAARPLLKPFYRTIGSIRLAGLIALIIGIWLFSLI